MHSHRWLILLVALAGCSQVVEPIRAPLERLDSRAHASMSDSDAVQRLFDLGLGHHFAFDDAAATRSFRAAIRLDPQCAMCFWGVALTLGPTVHSPITPENVPDAYRYALRALELAASASDRERDYIVAMMKRYREGSDSDQSALNAAYATAMRDLAAKYPEDAQAATLYAEALLIARRANQPVYGAQRSDNDELLASLERALSLDPGHPGAHRLYLYSTVSHDLRQPQERVALRGGGGVLRQTSR
jgi:hypothetical protein